MVNGCPARSSKSQAPSSREAPNFKLQPGRAPFGAWCLVFLWSLELGIWSFCHSSAHQLESHLTLSDRPYFPHGIELWLQDRDQEFLPVSRGRLRRAFIPFNPRHLM